MHLAKSASAAALFFGGGGDVGDLGGSSGQLFVGGGELGGEHNSARGRGLRERKREYDRSRANE